MNDDDQCHVRNSGITAIAVDDDSSNNDREDAKIPKSSFSKSLSFFEKQQHEHQHQHQEQKQKQHTALTKKSSSSFTSLISSKKTIEKFKQSQPLSSPLSSFPLSLASSLPLKQPQRRNDDVITERNSNKSISSSYEGSAFDESRHSSSSASSSSEIPTDSDRSTSSVALLRQSIRKKNQERKPRRGKKKKPQQTQATAKQNRIAGGNEDAEAGTNSEHPRQDSRTVVKFHRKVKIRKIRRIVDMPEEDLQALYYSNNEMIDMRNMLRAKIRIIKEQQQQQQQKNGDIRSSSSSRHTTLKDVYDATDHDDNDNGLESLLCCASYKDENCDCCSINDNNNYSSGSRKESYKDTKNDDVEDDTITITTTTTPTKEDELEDDLVACFRGLEQEFPIGKQRRRRNKIMARDIVFEEQRYWRETQEQQHNTNDDEVTFVGVVNYGQQARAAIADAYRTAARSAVQQAFRVGTNDEAIAIRIWK